MGTMATRTVRFIRKGEKGEDAITIIVTPENIVMKKKSIGQVARVKVGVFEGEKEVAYDGVGGEEGYVCSTLDLDAETSNKLKWSFTVDAPDYNFEYVLILKNDADIDIDIPFTVTYKGITYKKNIRFTTVSDGERGNPGPSLPPLRGPQDWENLPVGYNLYAGEAGEPYKDVVLYKGNYYSCVKAHTKEADNYPGSPKNVIYNLWQLSDKMELVASKILLAAYALVKNLGVEVIEMRDSAGNVQFMAKDGNVICNTGTFNNVTVQGTVKADKGYFRGFITKGVTTLTKKNILAYLKKYIVDSAAGKFEMYEFDFEKLSNIIYIMGDFPTSIWGDVKEATCVLPSIYQDVNSYTAEQLDNARRYIGTELLIYNLSDKDFGVTGAITNKENEATGTYFSIGIQRNYLYKFVCKSRWFDNQENVYWVMERGSYKAGI